MQWVKLFCLKLQDLISVCLVIVTNYEKPSALDFRHITLDIGVAIFQKSVQQTPGLKSYGLLASNISSVSGFSSGGALAFQFYLSHSSVLKGVGIFSGLMYECGLGQPWEVLKMYQCSQSSFNYNEVVRKIEETAEQGLFDPLENLKTRKHYIHHGRPDPIVPFEQGTRIAKFFKEKSSKSQLMFKPTGAAHGYPTESCGYPCPTVFPPSITGCLSCGWAGAFESLNYIYEGNLARPSEAKFSSCKARNSFPGLYIFDQTEFFPPGKTNTDMNMNPTGYIYVPSACREDASRCTLHVHIHGCGQEASSWLVQTDYIKSSGVTAVAEENNIIVIFPQADFGVSLYSLNSISMSNVLQCWDFVGATGEYYGTKKGPQIQAIKGMVDRVLGITK